LTSYIYNGLVSLDGATQLSGAETRISPGIATPVYTIERLNNRINSRFNPLLNKEKNMPTKKKATAKKAVKKATAKKATKKKATAKKAAPKKKATAKKAAPKKATAKKKAAPKKKATAKKAAPKKAKPKKVAKPKKAAKPKTKRKPNAAFMAPVRPDAMLGAVVGSNAMPRTEITKKLWDYIKKNGLQDKVNRRNINADEKLRPIFGKSTVTMFEMTKLVSNHINK
jgi:chromatin remodeling complex protein RSC6